jgi:uncharacterized Fe-S cluster protein YjdI
MALAAKNSVEAAEIFIVYVEKPCRKSSTGLNLEDKALLYSQRRKPWIRGDASDSLESAQTIAFRIVVIALHRPLCAPSMSKHTPASFPDGPSTADTHVTPQNRKLDCDKQGRKYFTDCHTMTHFNNHYRWVDMLQMRKRGKSRARYHRLRYTTRLVPSKESKPSLHIITE